jgi:hypothetical protein
MSDHEYICAYCGEAIPDAVIERRHYTLSQLARPIYCNQQHLIADRQARGFYKAISPLGNAAQMQIKAATGQRPGREGRAAHMRRVNAKRRGGNT